MKNDIINYLENKKILIVGYGREGKSCFNFIKANSINAQVAIADINEIEVPEGVPFCFGEHYLERINEYDLVIKSPGVVLPNKDKKITSLTEIFLNFCKNIVIGVTGTKGKSTTSSLIYHILRASGKDALLLGNIGLPAFDQIDDIKDDTIIVYELSCHQLENIHVSPHIAVLLNIYEEHLDHYHKMDAYAQTKKNIYTYQTENDYLIYGDITGYVSRDELNNIVSNKHSIINDNIGISDIKTSLVGSHNLMNIKAAIMASRLVGLQDKAILKAIESFKPLEHRLELVGTYEDIIFYNDSIATAAEAVMSAVEALKNVNTLILGGYDRGLDYHKLVEFLSNSSVQNILLLPATNERFLNLFKEYKSLKNIIEVKDMEEAVNIAFKVTEKNKICLLSPAAASYGFYKDFKERGNHFKSLVQKYQERAD